MREAWVGPSKPQAAAAATGVVAARSDCHEQPWAIQQQRGYREPRVLRVHEENEMELLVVAGILLLNIGLWWKLRTDDSFLQEYVRSSPKAFIWRKLLGEERAAQIIRTRLVPFGMALWVMVLVALGGAQLAAMAAG